MAQLREKIEQQADEIEELKRKFEAQREEVEILEEDIEEIKGQSFPKKRIILKGLLKSKQYSSGRFFYFNPTNYQLICGKHKEIMVLSRKIIGDMQACDICEQYLKNMENVQFYGCRKCPDGGLDICLACVNDKKFTQKAQLLIK